MTQESVIQEELAALFDRRAARAAFATHWRETAADLQLEVTGVGPLRFPISQATVRRLRSVARQSGSLLPSCIPITVSRPGVTSRCSSPPQRSGPG